jgi:hypothetical protein
MAVEIQLTRGYVAVVDDCDADLAARRWHVMVSTSTAYAKCGVWVDGKAKAEYLHRVILARKLGRELLPTEFCDHISGDGLDDRRENLRIATSAENQRNLRINSLNKSGFKGVRYYAKTGKWRAEIKVHGKKLSLGYFASPEAAHAAYCKAAVEHFGEFANFGGRK